MPHIHLALEQSVAEVKDALKGLLHWTRSFLAHRATSGSTTEKASGRHGGFRISLLYVYQDIFHSSRLPRGNFRNAAWARSSAALAPCADNIGVLRQPKILTCPRTRHWRQVRRCVPELGEDVIERSGSGAAPPEHLGDAIAQKGRGPAILAPGDDVDTWVLRCVDVAVQRRPAPSRGSKGTSTSLPRGGFPTTRHGCGPPVEILDAPGRPLHPASTRSPANNSLRRC